jgi:hypothetical protein
MRFWVAVVVVCRFAASRAFGLGAPAFENEITRIISTATPSTIQVCAFFGRMPGGFEVLFWTSGTALEAKLLSGSAMVPQF